MFALTKETNYHELVFWGFFIYLDNWEKWCIFKETNSNNCPHEVIFSVLKHTCWNMHFLPILKAEDTALICSYTISSQEATVKWGARYLCNHRNYCVFNAMQMLPFFYKLNCVTVIKWIQGNKSSVKYIEIPHLDCNQLCCLLRLFALFKSSVWFNPTSTIVR